jgi:glutamate--cysteine ligase
VGIAQRGLGGRARLNPQGHDERLFLEPLVEIVDSGCAAADLLLARFNGPWKGDIDHVFQEFAF